MTISKSRARVAPILSGIRKSIQEERTAASHYRARAQVASNRGDMVTAKLYLHIAHEEDVHAREFTQRLRQVDK